MLKILIADDHELFIEGLIALLSDAADITFSGIAHNGLEAIELANLHPDADLFIMDISMPKMDGIEAMKELKRMKSTIPILALTQNSDGGSVAKAMKAGASGYIIKTSGKSEFLDAIRAVAAGEQHFSPSATTALISTMTGREEQTALTRREREILKLIAAELTTNEIAEKLFISPYTVETHRKNLIQKLNVRSLAGLVRYAVEHGLADEE
ncbi:MAG: response regulator [Candidatus Kapaibacterium sp.]